MSDVGTIVQQIYADTHGLMSLTDIRRKVLDAMRFHRDKHLWFSERTARFNLTAGRQNYAPGDGYGLPADVVEIVSKNVWIVVSGNEDYRLRCTRVDRTTFDYSLSQNASRSQPFEWSWWQKQLQFYPIPSSGLDIVELRYVRDIGIPVTRYDAVGTLTGGAPGFVFMDPTGATPWTGAQLDAYTNDWTDPAGAGDMIRERAHYLVYQVIKDLDAAQVHLQTWLELEAQVEGESEGRTEGGDSIAPNILGGGDNGDLWGFP